jgi:hypothetical protein
MPGWYPRLRFQAAPVDCATVIEHRPSSGAGSCTNCLAPLDLDAVKSGGTWYCCMSCARGLAREREGGLPEERLYHRPKRFFRARPPKELRSAQSASSVSK